MKDISAEELQKLHDSNIMKKILCWWFGHNPDDYAYSCLRCGALDISDADLVGYTRHSRFCCFLTYWFFRKWFPAKCPDCGRRGGDHYDCLPF